MNRRGFLGSILALAAAPAIVRAESLMKIVVPEQKIVVPDQELLAPQEDIFVNYPVYNKPIGHVVAVFAGLKIGDILTFNANPNTLYKVTAVLNGLGTEFEIKPRSEWTKHDHDILLPPRPEPRRGREPSPSPFGLPSSRIHAGNVPGPQLPSRRTAMASRSQQQAQWNSRALQCPKRR